MPLIIPRRRGREEARGGRAKSTSTTRDQATTDRERGNKDSKGGRMGSRCA